jgi:2-polyprenyl-6-methoxyphenol hydroxylase-like FAD-dependent oxidoreductase
MQKIATRCCIAGGGPAGMMLGFLLARAGIDTVVLEKHADFLRDFRGDTIHPSTLQLMDELGLLEEFLRQPHTELRQIGAEIGNTTLNLADFSRLPTKCKFVALMPQWDFLNFLAAQGARYKPFHLMMRTEASDLIHGGDRITGLRGTCADGPIEIHAELVIGADGRHSTVRERAGLMVTDLGAPMDVLWLRISRRPDEEMHGLGHAEAGRIFIMIDRGDYWQCAFIIPKGSADDFRRRDISEFRRMILELSPWLDDRVNEIKSWDDVKLLTVKVDRLTKWYRAGLLCIGDAAHAMSPIGGVGINLAVQDAVATANILAEPLSRGAVNERDLARVQRRRELPARLTQMMQIAIQNRVVRRVLAGTAPPRPPLMLQLIDRFPLLQGIPARAIGLGVRPEHIATPEAQPPDPATPAAAA